MTSAEALAEARRRWGEDAYARPPFFIGGRWSVGYMAPLSPENMGGRDRLMGRGRTPEAAFEDADRRAQVKP